MKNRILWTITAAAVAVIMTGLSITGVENLPVALAVMAGAAAWLLSFGIANR